MAGPRKIILNEQQRRELEETRDHSSYPYMREKAAAILKVASGISMTKVGKNGLLRPVRQEAISGWINRYLEEGVEGLRVKSGRGRKPAFFPSARKYRNSRTRSTRDNSSFSLSLR